MTANQASSPNLADAGGPIDAVVTWVDGSDPGFAARRALYADKLAREDPALARMSELKFASARYIEHDEIRYCVRSILNHAPWIRTVWIVTDDQFPASFDRAALDPRVVFVSHRELYRDLPDALPIFNSGAIDMMLWQIEGLSDRFLYFNDDFFLTRPAVPEDFFLGDRPVLRGRWSALDRSSPTPAWLKRRVRSAEIFGFDADHFFKEAHTPYSLSRPVIETLFATHPDLFEANARLRFRSATGHFIIALHNHFCLKHDRAVIDDARQWLVFDRYPAGVPTEEMAERLERIRSNRFISTCFNSLGDFARTMPCVYDYLDAGTGPRLSFET